MPRIAVLGEGGSTLLSEDAYLDEASLQRLLEERPELIALEDVEPSASCLLPIGREVTLAGQALDLLFLDATGRLVAVETKLRRNPEVRRQVVGQVLEYGAYLSAWHVDDVERQATNYLSDGATPDRFRGQDLYTALAQLSDSAEAERREFEPEMRGKIARALSDGDITLLIAVDRVVEPLRALVTFVNGATSRLGVYLLEVQQYRAPDGIQIASINVFGGPARPTTTSTRGPSYDEPRFLDKLQSQARPRDAAVVRELYSFMQEQAEALVWGTGATYGTVAFAVQAGGRRVTVFGATTKGQVYITSGSSKRMTEDRRREVSGELQAIGIEVPATFTAGATGVGFDASRLTEQERLQQFEALILRIGDWIKEGE